jgi:Tol biopolymer transport system component
LPRSRVGVGLLSALAVLGGVVAQSALAAPPATLAPVTPVIKGNGRIVFVTDRDGNSEIYSMLLDSTRMTNLTNEPASDFDPAVSPDGTRVAFATSRTGNSEIFVMNLDGTGATNLSNNAKIDTQPAWSADGSRLAFVRKNGANQDIWVMKSNGTQQTKITGNAAADTQPAWSPTNTKIAFTSKRTGNNEVFVMNTNGTGVTQLTNIPTSDSQPAWSWDASWIAFTTKRDGNNEIYVMNADGTSPVNVTNDPGSDFDPAFSPDHSTRIALTSDRTGDQESTLITVTPTKSTYGVAIDLSQDVAANDTHPSWQPLPPPPDNGSPIEHVVVLFMENHSFDNVLGALCVQDVRCDGATTGKVSNGSTINLLPANNIVPPVGHGLEDQQTAVHGGLMDNFDKIPQCSQSNGYICYQAFQPSQIPTTTSLVRSFVVADRMFELDTVATWGAHTVLATSTLNGFLEGNPLPGSQGDKFGCDSGLEANWYPVSPDDYLPTGPSYTVPSCYPDINGGTGPNPPTVAPWVSTMMDRVDEAGLTWRQYAASMVEKGYLYAICPTFAECLYTDQNLNTRSWSQFEADAAAGDLPNVTFLMPDAVHGQHNTRSMLTGENWIADQVNAVMNGPLWDSTAIFLTWDDCGCFYDHVPPPPGLGIREPMVIISPYARAGFTDSGISSFASLSSYTERTFGLAPLTVDDAEAYAWEDSFDYSQTPIAPFRLKSDWKVTKADAKWMREHPADDLDDWT